MVDFETELRITRELFEKRLKTVKRIKHLLRGHSKTSSEYAAGKVALKVAEAELHIAYQQLEGAIQRIPQQPDADTKLRNTTNSERDHFYEALARVDPKSRLQLAC